MTRLKNTVLGLVAMILALGALGFFASLGLAVLGLIAAVACIAALVGAVATFLADKRGPANA